MEVLVKRKDFKVSTDVFHKICREFKSELKDAKKDIEKLNEIDYQYNKKIVYLDKLLETIDGYMEKETVEQETKNLMVAYYGNPVVTIELCLMALMKGQMINLVIDDMCLGVNKLIVELYKELLKEYKIFDVVSFSNYESKEVIEENKNYFDKMFFLGDKNLYNICKHISGTTNIEYIPYNIIDIYCEDEDFYDLARDIFNYCFENSVESEIYEDMSFDEVVDIFNNYGENYCSIILTKNKELAERFKKEVNSKFVYANENPFKDENLRIPEFF
ncbi:MAG: hypothetical protein ACI4VN_06060 [Clostridia bacterium]